VTTPIVLAKIDIFVKSCPLHEVEMAFTNFVEIKNISKKVTTILRHMILSIQYGHLPCEIKYIDTTYKYYMY